MRPFALISVTLLAASAALAQEAVKLTFEHTDGDKNMQEVATLVRTIADIQDASVDLARKTLTLNSTPEQIKLAQWIFDQFDAPDTASSAKREFQMPGDGDNLVQLYFVKNAARAQDFQEIATTVRTVADIRRVFTYDAPHGMVLRGSADQLALAEWLIGELDQPVTSHTSAVHEYRMTGGFDHDENTVRVFYLSHTPTPQAFQEVATATRTIADIRRVFTCNAPRAMVMRSTPDAVALAAWLVDQLDTQNTGVPRKASPVYSYQAATRDEGVAIRVFFLAHAGSVDDFQKAARQVRATANIRRVLTYNGPRALVVRGTTDQLAVAAQLVKDIE